MSLRQFVLGVLLGAAATFVCLVLDSDKEQPVLRWPGPQLRIADHTGRPVSMQRAVRLWNRTGMKLRLRLVDDDRQADVRAVASRDWQMGCDGSGVVGCATIGRRPWPPLAKPLLQLLPRSGSGRDQGQFTDVAAHELGHILGLYHSDRSCALMNPGFRCPQPRQVSIQQDCPLLRLAPSLAPGHCPAVVRTQELCGPNLSERRRMVQIYGGQLRRGYQPWCRHTAIQAWQGWCALPAWVPPGYARPGWMVRDGRGWRCGPRTPVDAMLEVGVMQLDLREHLLQLRGRGGVLPRPARYAWLAQQALLSSLERDFEQLVHQLAQRMMQRKTSLERRARCRAPRVACWPPARPSWWPVVQ